MSGIFGTHFYHRITRKLVIALGTLFNDIQMVRYNKAGTTELERILVPIMYGQKEKFIYRLKQDPTLTRDIQIQLPRMSFELVGLNYDPTRKQNSLVKDYKVKDSNSAYSQYAPIPYNFDFTLSIYVRNIEDGTQIVEQILPMFRPDYSLTIELVDGMDIKKDVPIIFNGISYNVDHEADGNTMRLITWDLNFTIKAYLFGPTDTSKIIKKANTVIYDASSQITGASGSSRITVLNMKAGGSRDYKEGEIAFQGETFLTYDTKADVVSWDETNRKLYVTNIRQNNDQPGKFKANNIIIGVETNAQWNLNSYYISNVPIVIGYVQPSPNTATADSDYGFSTQILEFPDTV